MGPAMGPHDGVMGQPIGMGMMGAFGPGVGSALDREARAAKGFEWSPDQPYDGPVNGTNGRGFEAAYPERFGGQEEYWREREWNGLDRQGDDYWRKAELDARWARNGWGRHEVLSGEQVAQMAVEQQATTVMLRNVPNKLSCEEVMNAVESLGFTSRYDLCFLPIDRVSKNGKGYG